MEKSTVIDQLCIFADSLKQVSIALSQLQCSFKENGSDCVHCLMVSSRSDIMRTLMELNKCLLSINVTEKVYSGSLVLAPRFFQGTMCWDLAVVTSITERDNSSVAENATQLVSICLDTLATKATQIVSIAWIRPQNKYELHSAGIEFTPAQLRCPSEALQLLCAQETALCSINNLKNMLYLEHEMGESMGMWYPGVVDCPSSGSAAAQQQVTLCSRRSGTGGAYLIVTRSLLLAEVCPLPGAQLAGLVEGEESQEGDVDCRAAADGNSSDTESSEGDDIYEGVQSLPSYLQLCRSRHASSSSIVSANSDPQWGSAPTAQQGSWERHTKGKYVEATPVLLINVRLAWLIYRLWEQNSAQNGLQEVRSCYPISVLQ